MLILYSTKLRNTQPQNDEITYDVELAADDLISEEELSEQMVEKTEIETNKAYNEAEKFISAIENKNTETVEDTQGKLNQMDEAIAKAESNKNDLESLDLEEPIVKSQDRGESNSNNKPEITEGGNRKTTISYRLENRKDLALPNPVYTCYGSGKIVINIEVNSLGEVKKSSFNKSASSTSNQCLIDAALQYASQARFTTDASREKQLGTITFNFPGQ